MIKILASCLMVLAINLSAQPLARECRGPVSNECDSSQQIADRVVGSKIPVVLDFWAPWCGPCKLLDPVMDSLRKEYRNRVLFIKANVDVDRTIAGYFRVQGIPAVFVICDSSVQKCLVGFHQKTDYKTALDLVLLKSNTKKLVPKPGIADTVKKEAAGKKG